MNLKEKLKGKLKIFITVGIITIFCIISAIIYFTQKITLDDFEISDIDYTQDVEEGYFTKYKLIQNAECTVTCKDKNNAYLILYTTQADQEKPDIELLYNGSCVISDYTSSSEDTLSEINNIEKPDYKFEIKGFIKINK